MITFKMWKACRKGPFGRVTDTWLRKGRFLFGVIPLYIADMQNREEF